MIQTVTDVRIVVGPAAWPLEPSLAARVADHWARAVEANPRLWDGRVFGTVAPGFPGGVAIEDGVLTATALEGSFSAFLAWRDWGFPEIGIRNLFGSALILSSDGALIFGVMGGHTANPGRIYPPGGSLDRGDLTASGLVDVFASVDRELAEETGLRAAEAELSGTFVAFEGPRISVARLFRFPERAERLADIIRQDLSTQADRELDDIFVLRRAADLPDDGRVPGYARALAAHVLGA